jgi:23S rRNA pseudouridine2604 synthase
MEPLRINKYLRDMKIASRREADELIEKGLVEVNGSIASKGLMIKEGDKVIVRGKKKIYRYFAYYKPRGISTQDLPGKESVVTIWKKKNLFPVGRLDKESEGLIILTNDGRVTREILSKKENYEKEYIVETREKLRKGVVDIFEKGMEVKKFGKLLPVKAEIINENRIKMILREGKKHQIRIMLEELSYTVTKLKRVRIGNVFIGNLKPGEIKEIDFKKLAM